MNLLPAKLAPYVKAWATLIGVIVATVATLTDLPAWVTIAGSLATTLAVYFGPNAPLPQATKASL